MNTKLNNLLQLCSKRVMKLEQDPYVLLRFLNECRRASFYGALHLFWNYRKPDCANPSTSWLLPRSQPPHYKGQTYHLYTVPKST